jgi:hypothetical protein
MIPGLVYREFGARRLGWLRWEPVYYAMNAEGQPETHSMLCLFRTRTAALRAASMACTQYNDGLWAMRQSEEAP